MRPADGPNVAVGCFFVTLWAVIGAWSPQNSRQLPKFEDYPVKEVLPGTIVSPRLTGSLGERYATQIREGVEYGYGVSTMAKSNQDQTLPGL